MQVAARCYSGIAYTANLLHDTYRIARIYHRFTQVGIERTETACVPDFYIISVPCIIPLPGYDAVPRGIYRSTFHLGNINPRVEHPYLVNRMFTYPETR